MSEAPENTKWLTDAGGARIGIQVFELAGQTSVKLLLPDHGTEKTIDRAGAARLVEMLQNGVTFSKIMGDRTFDLLLDEIPSVDGEG